MTRKKTVKGVTLPAKLRKSKTGTTYPSMCIACGKPIDLGVVSTFITRGEIYKHACGRVLYDPGHGKMEPML